MWSLGTAPFVVKVDDPLLTPKPPARRNVKTWEEAFAWIRQNSTDERSAQAAVARAEGRWQQSLSLLLPNARFSFTAAVDLLHPSVPPLGQAGAGTTVGIVASGITPSAPLGTGVLNATQSLVDVGAWKGLQSSAAAERSAILSAQEVRRRLILGLARALVAVVAAERVAELNRLGLQLALERSALTTRTQQLGAATQLDVVRVKQDVELARGILLAGDEQLLRTREALGLTLGFDEAVGVEPSFDLRGLVQQTRQHCAPISDWNQRADLLAARENVRSAEHSRSQAVVGYFPSLGLSTNLIGMTVANGPPPLAFTSWNLSAILSFPIWEGGGRGGTVRERTGIVTQTAQTLEASRRQVSIEVARAQRGVDVADSLLQSANSSRTLAAQLDELTRRSFEVGRGTSLELVQSAAALRQADAALATREYESVNARLDALLTEVKCEW